MSVAASRRSFRTRLGRTLPFTTLGFGSAPLGNFPNALGERDCDATVTAAWRSGIRYFDTAPFYGLSLAEQRVGRILKQRPRDEFLISTKVGRMLEPCAEGEQEPGLFVDTPPYRVVFDYSYDGVMRSYEESLARLGLDRIDILYVHDIDAFVHGGRAASEARIEELMKTGGWRALDELRASGAVSAIGAGVNEWQPCVRLLEVADPDIFLLAGRYTLLEQPPADEFFPKCEAQGARVVIGGPFNSGVLAGKGTYNYSVIPAAIAERVKAIDSVCREHGVALREAALQFVVAHPLVVSVIPGAVSVAEVDDNVASLGKTIPAALWRELEEKGLLPAAAFTGSITTGR
jgi:D-threo-aldose 1-dehydrogenase